MYGPMEKIPYLIISILFSSGLFAQGVYNNGAKIVIGTGITVNISGISGNYRNETNVSDGSIDLSGTLAIAGNVTNNAVAEVLTTSATGSTVVLSGTASQTLGGSSASVFTLPNLTVNNPAGIIIAKDARVNGSMTFTSGRVDIGNTNFTFGPLAAIAGTPSATSMLIATGSGQVLKSWSGSGSFTYPVGDNTGTAEYSPVTLNFTAGTFAPGANAGVNLVNDAFADPYISGSYLNRYWNVTQTGITGFTCDAAFNHPIADVVGTESEIYGVRITPSPVSLYGPVNVVLHQLTTTGLTSFGTFTGALGQRTLNLTAFLEGLYIGGGLMRQAQSASGNQFTGTTADQITVELHSAAAGQYATINYSASAINLNTSGQATLIVPATYCGSYYLTIGHRNSIVTVSALPVVFSASTISYDFTTSKAQAYGDNLKLLEPGINGIYGGDANNDGAVTLSDILAVQNDAALFSNGYLVTDLNGDGAIDVLDLILAQNNTILLISTVNP